MRVSAPAFLRASKLGLSAGSPVIVLKLVDFISLFSDFSGASVPKSYTSVRAWGSYFIIYLRILFRSKDKKSLIIRDRSNRIHIYIYIYIYDMISYYYSNVAYSMRRYSMINIKYYYTFICSLRAWLKSRIRKLRPYN
jgi:hypothetical protein